jgi:hypothetical protein
MSVTPQQIAEEARLYRESGHVRQSAQLIDLAKTRYPSEECLELEAQRLRAAQNPRFRSLKNIMNAAVDLLGMPVFLIWLALSAYMLASLLFVPSG